MGLPLGRNIPLSPARRLVCDWLHFSAQASYVSVERRMQLAPVAAARASAPLRPGWFPIMVKAFSLACRQHPELRRSYLSFPRPRLYEHAVSVAAMIMEARSRRRAGDLELATAPAREPRCANSTKRFGYRRRPRSRKCQAFGERLAGCAGRKWCAGCSGGTGSTARGECGRSTSAHSASPASPAAAPMACSRYPR